MAMNSRETPRPTTHRADNGGATIPYLWIGIAAIVLVIFRIHAFDVPLERDEGNYAYIGSRLLDGARLYTDVWDHQPPGVFVLFSAVIAAFGDSPTVFRIHAIGWSLASLVLIACYVRIIDANKVTMISAVFLWAIVSSDPGTAGDGCNREIYMNTMILAAWMLAAWIESKTRSGGPEKVTTNPRIQLAILGAGLFLGVASAMKTVVAFHWLILAAWLSVLLWKRIDGAIRLRSVLKSVVLFGACPAILWGGIALYFAATGRWGEFIEAVFSVNLAYADSDEPVARRFIAFFTNARGHDIFGSALPLWICGLLGVVGLSVKGLSSARANLSLLLAAASYGAICLPGQFWAHYYYLAVCPAVLASAWLLGFLAESNSRYSSRGGISGVRSAMLVAGPATIVFGATLAHQCADYLFQPPLGITERRYKSRDFWARAQGENVRRVTHPKDEIFVFGDDASIYYYAQRHGASRYTMLTALRERFPGHQARREIMLTEIKEHRPRLILVVLGEPTFPEWVDFLHTRYDAVGYDFRDVAPHEAVFMVLADREKPIETIDWNWDRTMMENQPR